MICPIPERYPHDGRHPDIKPPRLLAIIREIRCDTYDTRTPAVEPKHLVGEVDDLPSLSIGEFRTTTWTGPLADVFGTEFFVEFGLEGGDAFGGGAVFGERGETEECVGRGRRGDEGQQGWPGSAVRACVKGHGAAGGDGWRTGMSGGVVESVEEMSTERACHRRG